MGDLIPRLLGASFAGIKVKIWLAVAAAALALIFMVIKIADNRDKRMVETAQDSGASQAVVEGQRDILNQVESANAAEQEIRRGGDAAKFERCLRNATDATRANCERFRPLPN